MVLVAHRVKRADLERAAVRLALDLGAVDRVVERLEEGVRVPLGEPALPPARPPGEKEGEGEEEGERDWEGFTCSPPPSPTKSRVVDTARVVGPGSPLSKSTLFCPALVPFKTRVAGQYPTPSRGAT